MRLLKLLGSTARWGCFGALLVALLRIGGARRRREPDPPCPAEGTSVAPPPARVAVAVAMKPAPAAPAIAVGVPPRARAAHADARPRPRRRTRTRTLALLRLPAAAALYTAYGVTLAVLLALTVPLALDMRPLVVLSGSMEPVLHVGDVTVVQRIAPRDARVGDVVTFKAPQTGHVTTHRLRAVRGAPHDRYVFVTKGDANNSLERWSLPADGQLSRAVYTVPLVGRALLLIHTPLGWALLVGLPLVLLAAQEIRRIWRSGPAPEAADAALMA